MDIAKGIAIAGIWIGCGIATAFQPIATFSFIFATMATAIVAVN